MLEARSLIEGKVKSERRKKLEVAKRMQTIIEEEKLLAKKEADDRRTARRNDRPHSAGGLRDERKQT